MLATRTHGAAAEQARRRAAAIESASQTLGALRAQSRRPPMHRALVRLRTNPQSIAQAVLLPLGACLALAWAQPWIMHYWQLCLNFWLGQLGLPLQAQHHGAIGSSIRFIWLASDRISVMPSNNLKAATATVLALLSLSTLFYPDKRLPLKCLVRILCTVQGLALLFFWLAPSRFPYTITDHLGDMIGMAHVMLYAIPVLLAIGYYMLPARLHSKLGHTVLILGYFLLLAPHKLILHAVILHYGSLLFMPLLYICFGTVLDVLLFIALYAWVVSRLPLSLPTAP